MYYMSTAKKMHVKGSDNLDFLASDENKNKEYD